MTVNATSTRELTIGDLIRLAYQQAGLNHLAESPNEEQERFGQDKLEVITEMLVTEGGFVRLIGEHDLTTVSGTSEYTLPTNFLDLIDTAMYLPAGSTTGQTAMTKISRDQWMRLSNKTSAGHPRLYYSNRSGATLKVRVWPVPDEAGTITFQYQKLAADTDDSSATPEAGRHWADFFVFRLAHDLALAAGHDVGRCGYIRRLYEQALEKAKAYSNEAVVDQMILAHRTPFTDGC